MRSVRGICWEGWRGCDILPWLKKTILIEFGEEEPMEEKIKELKAHLQEINDLRLASSMLSWDRFTYMPAGGAQARGRQMSRHVDQQRTTLDSFVANRSSVRGYP